MFENELDARPEKHPLTNLMVILLMVALGFIIVGPLMGFFFALPFYEGSMLQLAEAIQFPVNNPDIKVPLYIIQGFATIVGLIVAPALYLVREKKSVNDFSKFRHVD